MNNRIKKSFSIIDNNAYIVKVSRAAVPICSVFTINKEFINKAYIDIIDIDEGYLRG